MVALYLKKKRKKVVLLEEEVVVAALLEVVFEMVEAVVVGHSFLF